MACRITCKQCELDRQLEDSITAHKQARDHEASYSDHWVILYESPSE